VVSRFCSQDQILQAISTDVVEAFSTACSRA
jgi:hypothetical protein